jgi:hypothetical protein
LIGRAFLYGLGAGGEAGVTQCLDIIRKELDVTMALCGLRDVTLVSADILVEPSWRLTASPPDRHQRDWGDKVMPTTLPLATGGLT